MTAIARRRFFLVEQAPGGGFYSRITYDNASYQGSDQIAVEIQHKDPFLADKGAI